MHFESDTSLYHVIGANIKYYREQAKLTQIQLAEQSESVSAIFQKLKLPDAIKAFLYLFLIKLLMYLV